MARFKLDAASIPVIILAGGLSSRMGRNKALVEIGGVTMLTRIAHRIAEQTTAVSLNADPERPKTNDLRLVPDTIEGKAGPLAGILAAMRDAAATHPMATHVATVPIDCPFFPRDLLARLAEVLGGPDEMAIPASGGQDHPVFGLWPVSAANDLEAWLTHTDQHRRVRDFLRPYTVTEVNFPLIETSAGPFDPFFNVNRPEDIIAAEKWLGVIG
ncbi:molybdenum cofactor guanylyltransferase MobA [Rhizobium sp. BK376]|uniref:molybdenum cofactor guanylyltransferase MobA n=1 Tax=Rhizobium sp. BK376 TaxID=2512149 RepID=UPI00104A739E|nr:molybdenum cofactor guanylyltransferase MobA [Rhizobium sp. BK376]TCR83943.1 molybdenum cofactor guanylyltransferase [Rhizobium sp. BK376]